MEIARRQEAIDLAGSSRDDSLPVTMVETRTAHDAPPTLLDSSDRARDVTRALEEAITRVRETMRSSRAR
jgi:hypothetical protein